MPRRAWTDHELHDAIANSRTWAEVIRTLAISRGGSTRARLRRRAAELGIDTTHLVRHAGDEAGRTWTDAQLRDAVSHVCNLRQVFLALDLAVGGGAWATMRRHILRLELDTSHWDRPVNPDPAGPLRPALPDWSSDELRDAFGSACSFAEVMRQVGLDPRRKRGRAELHRRLRTLGLDPQTLAGRGWAVGSSRPGSGRPIRDLLVRGALTDTVDLKRRLLREGLLDRWCACCGIREWLGEPAPLHLDHVDGDRANNLLENLRLLCPNCHALTDTYCGRNVGRR